MIKKSTSEYGQAVSITNMPEGTYENTHIELRNKKGEFVGTLALNGRGQVSLISGEGYNLTNYEVQ